MPKADTPGWLKGPPEFHGARTCSRVSDRWFHPPTTSDICRRRVRVAASAFRSFYFFQRIERLEIEARRLAGVAGEGPASSATRNKVVGEVSALRRDGEMKSYIDLLFLALVILLCISKIVTN